MEATAIDVKTSPGRSRPNNVDRHAGARLRQRRVELGMTQLQAAAATGVTYQQQHKYELGINRLSIGRALAACRAFGIDLNYLVEGFGCPPRALHKDNRSIIELVENYRRLRPHQRDAIRALVRNLLADPDAPA